MLMFDQLVAHMLLEMVAPGAQVGHAIDDIMDEMKAIELVLTRMSNAVVIVPSSL